VISVILTGIVTHPAWIVLALVVMFIVASSVATGRVGWSWHDFAMMSSSIAAGVILALIVVFATGALELTSRYALAIGAIVIGNAMSIATLTGRMFTQSVRDHWDEVEGWLALGARPRRSTIDLARRAVRDAMIPSIDQTKTTGLVVLPGAFVGAIFRRHLTAGSGTLSDRRARHDHGRRLLTSVLVATWDGERAHATGVTRASTKPSAPRADDDREGDLLGCRARVRLDRRRAFGARHETGLKVRCSRSGPG
jgi:putative ABC transport system permease protein